MVTRNRSKCSFFTFSVKQMYFSQFSEFSLRKKNCRKFWVAQNKKRTNIHMHELPKRYMYRIEKKILNKNIKLIKIISTILWSWKNTRSYKKHLRITSYIKCKARTTNNLLVSFILQPTVKMKMEKLNLFS